jgi:drug/metabolite transporter (DMT)-like permease
VSGTATRPPTGGVSAIPTAPGDPSVAEGTATPGASHRAPWRMVVVAFAVVYVIWGSTYLGIYYAIQTIPVFLMGGLRFIVAGLALSGFAVARGAGMPRRREVWTTAVAGVLLLSCGTGSVIWAEQQVPTGVTALLLTTPLWMAVFEWMRGRRPSWGVVLGLVLGMAGLAILIDPRQVGAQRVAPIAAAVLVFGSCCWAAGSLYARYAPLPASPALATGLEMIWGGVALVAAAAVTGEFGRFDIAHVSAASWIAWTYLVVFGSVIAFTAYMWLVRNVAPAMTATYAFVCPVVAVLLGWAIAGEPLSPRTAAAGAAIVAAVAITTLAPRSEARATPTDASPRRRR